MESVKIKLGASYAADRHERDLDCGEIVSQTKTHWTLIVTPEVLHDILDDAHHQYAYTDDRTQGERRAALAAWDKARDAIRELERGAA